MKKLLMYIFSNAKEDGTENKSLVKNNTLLSFTPDMSKTGNTYTLYDVTNGLNDYDANVRVSCTDSNEYLKVTNEFDTSILEATKIRTGKVTIQVLKTNTTSTNVSCEITGNSIERNSKVIGTPAPKIEQHWILTDDADNDGKLSIGDLITLGTESFYVYDTTGDNIKALAQYNLLVGNAVDANWNTTPLERETGLQAPIAKGYTVSSPFIGTVTFDNDSNIYTESTIKRYVDAYGEVLNGMNGQVSNIGLITKEELENLKCSATSKTCSDAPSFVYATSYWTSSPFESNSYSALVTNSNGYFGDLIVYYGNNCGVRPVITISKSLFE